MKRAIKYRIYPTTEQAILFKKTFGCCRKVYNLMLADAINNHKITGKFEFRTPATFKQEYSFLKEVDSLALANKQQDLRYAFANRFSKKRKKKLGFPKFKSAKKARKSYTTNCQYPKLTNGFKQPTIRLYDNSIFLPKIGNVKAVVHKFPEQDWKIKSVTVSQEKDNTFYVSVLFDIPNVINNYVANPVNAIGFDYSSAHLYVDSNGNYGSDHRYFRESQKKLAKEQRKLVKKQGSKKYSVKSNRYLKQQHKVNKIYRHVVNQRLDHHHKLSTEIANQYDIVCVENLNMKAMSNKKFKNGKATMDNGYGMFLSMLEYKLSDRNKFLIRVDKWYPSSQICHVCGYRNPSLKDLSIRKWDCECCHTHHDRDINAAVNILNEGLRIYYELVA